MPQWPGRGNWQSSGTSRPGGTGKLGQSRPQQVNGKPTVNRPVRSRYASNKRGMPRQPARETLHTCRLGAAIRSQ